MKNFLLFACTVFLLACCNNKQGPDVSAIPVSVKIERFDKMFFGKVDTSNMLAHINFLQTRYPYFTNDFITHILGIPVPAPGMSDDSVKLAMNEVKRFFALSRPLYDSISSKYTEIGGIEKELSQAFRHVKYYFPAYNVPKVVAFIGPFDGPGIALTTEVMAVGLQAFAGKDFSFYTSTEGQELYPMYISRRFEAAYIAPNCMKAVAEDLFPDASSSLPLLEQMIEKGKQWYLLDKFLPQTADSLKTGYTRQQLKWCADNEGLVWNFLIRDADIYTTNPTVIKNYIGDAPSTQGMPETSPGNIGQWVGWQIVKAYAAKYADATPGAIMQLDAKKIFSEAKYKPK